MKKFFAVAIVMATLGGCAVYPAPYYGRGYYGPPAAVYVAPRPYYYGHW